MFSSRPREDQQQSLFPSTNQCAGYEETIVNTQSSNDKQLDRPLSAKQEMEKDLRKLLEERNFKAVTKLLLDSYDLIPTGHDAIIDSFLLVMKSVQLHHTHHSSSGGEFLSVCDIAILIFFDACEHAPPTLLPRLHKKAVSDLAVSVSKYCTDLSQFTSKKMEERNKNIANEFVHSLFQMQFNVVELFEHEPYLLLFALNAICQVTSPSETVHSTEDAICMLSLLIGKAIRKLKI